MGAGYEYRGLGSGLMLLYLPATVGLLALELWLGVPPPIAIAAAIVVTAVFTIVARRLNRLRSK